MYPKMRFPMFFRLFLLFFLTCVLPFPQSVFLAFGEEVDCTRKILPMEDRNVSWTAPRSGTPSDHYHFYRHYFPKTESAEQRCTYMHCRHCALTWSQGDLVPRQCSETYAQNDCEEVLESEPPESFFRDAVAENQASLPGWQDGYRAILASSGVDQNGILGALSPCTCVEYSTETEGPEPGPPAPPTNTLVTVSEGGDHVRIQWDVVSDLNLDTFLVTWRRLTQGYKSSSSDEEACMNPNNHSQEVSGNIRHYDFTENDLRHIRPGENYLALVCSKNEYGLTAGETSPWALPQEAPENAILPSMKIFPNPAQPGQDIRFQFSVPKMGRVNLKVFNVRGILIKDLANVHRDKTSSETIIWDGRTSNGERVASGVYLYRLTISGKLYYRGKVVLVR